MNGHIRPNYCDKCLKSCDYVWSHSRSDGQEYLKSHRWITFKVDLSKATAPFWMLLGEARSKLAHIAGVPLKPALEKHLLKVQLARGVQATTAIEGNTLSVQDVEKQIDGTLSVPPSKEYLAQEIQNVLDALNELLRPEIASGDLPPICPKRVKELNTILLKGLTAKPGVSPPGEIRMHDVYVGHYRGAPHSECEHLLYRLCEWLNGSDFEPPTDEWRIPYTLIGAIVAHLYIEWIHPFGDGNGRTGRLVEYQLLAMAGVPEVACHLLSNHYNDTRSEYYAQLERASATGGDILPFIEYAVRGFVDGLSQHLETVREQQWYISWINYVHEQMQTIRSRSKDRMLYLALELSLPGRDAVPRREISSLSAKTAVYQNKDKSLTRDLNTLEKLELVERTPAGYRARRETILAFLPTRHERRQPADPTPDA